MDVTHGQGTDWMSQALKICGLATILALIAFSALLWNFEQPPQAFNRVQNLERGSSRDEIVSKLGAPGNVRENGRTLVYTRPFAWGILYVKLDNEERFVGYVYDR